jgi:hypothetical protein
VREGTLRSRDKAILGKALLPSPLLSVANHGVLLRSVGGRLGTMTRIMQVSRSRFGSLHVAVRETFLRRRGGLLIVDDFWSGFASDGFAL